jgi:hypothetical protein
METLTNVEVNILENESQHLPRPARGWKPKGGRRAFCYNLFMRGSTFTSPRKGMETSSPASSLAAYSSRRVNIYLAPQGDGNYRAAIYRQWGAVLCQHLPRPARGWKH